MALNCLSLAVQGKEKNHSNLDVLTFYTKSNIDEKD